MLRFGLLGLFWVSSLQASPAPLNGGLDIGTSTSGSYEARNVFTNPAALGFDTALNGAEVSSALAFGSNSGLSDDLAFALGLGYFGFGAERLTATGLSRYQFALGVPVTHQIFFGTRLGLYRFSSGQSMNSWDVGLQFRPSSFLSVGMLFEQLNQPLLAGVAVPILSTFSISLRPLRRIELTFDTTTPSDAFFKQAAFQGVLGLTLAEGVKLRTGYHTDYKWLFGLQINLGNVSAYTSIHPSATRRFALGFQSGTKPYQSALAPPRAAKITLGPSLSEEKSSGGLISAPRRSLLDLLKDLEELESDRGVTTLLLQIENFPLGLAAAHEVHLALRRLRAAGKTVEIYLGNAGMKDYLIACAADRIYMDPAGEMRWLGVRSERYFLKGTLDKIGVEGEFLAAGKFKAAPEMFTRKESSEAARTAAFEEMKSLEGSLGEIFKQTRKVDSARWKKLTELGVLSTDEAVKEGLVDGVASYASVLAAREKKDFILPVLHRRKDKLALPPRVGVIVASGNIMPNRIRWLALSGDDQVTPSSMEKKLRQVENDDRIQTVVLRVSSPGGEVLASQQIASRLEETKTKKPITISMGDVAASGGYYISAPSRRIFAGPMSITGSIGVYLGKFSLSGLYKWIDLHKEVLTEGPYPGLLSEDRPWSKAERAVMQRRLTTYYDAFISYVAQQRSIPKQKVNDAAQGRVWTGKQAIEHQLVDELGGYYESIRYAARLRGYEPGDYEIWQIESGGGLFDLLSDDSWARAFSRSTTLSVLPPEMRELLWLTTLKDSPFLYLSPVSPPDA